MTSKKFENGITLVPPPTYQTLFGHAPSSWQETPASASESPLFHIQGTQESKWLILPFKIISNDLTRLECKRIIRRPPIERLGLESMFRWVCNAVSFRCCHPNAHCYQRQSIRIRYRTSKGKDFMSVYMTPSRIVGLSTVDRNFILEFKYSSRYVMYCDILWRRWCFLFFCCH